MLGVSACENFSELSDAELPEFVDQLVLNASFDNAEPISLEVSTTTWAYEAGNPEIDEDVLIELKRDGQPVSLSYNSFEERFTSNVVPKAGDIFTIAVFKDNYKTISSNLRIPNPLSSHSSGYIAGGGKDLEGRTGDVVFVEFDDPGTEDFYEVQFFYFNELANEFILFDFEISDETLRSPNTLRLNNGAFLFSDELFNGQTKRVSAVATAALTAGNSDVKYLVKLRKVSKDYWKYWRTLQQFRDQENAGASGPFGNAVILHSNVTAGLGVFMSSYLHSDTIR